MQQFTTQSNVYPITVLRVIASCINIGHPLRTRVLLSSMLTAKEKSTLQVYTAFLHPTCCKIFLFSEQNISFPHFFNPPLMLITMNAFPLYLLCEEHRKFTTGNCHFLLRYCINFAVPKREMPCYTNQRLMSSVFSVEVFPNAEHVSITTTRTLSFSPLFIWGITPGKVRRVIESENGLH